MKNDGTLIIKGSQIRSLLSLGECIAAVEEAFRLNAEGLSLPPGVLETLTESGGFHVKAAGLRLKGGSYYAAKVNGNFAQNKDKFGLPTVQGVVVLCDAANGRPLALMDSIEITALRTGAATAVAAKHLARSDSKVATVCGCGTQGRIQLRSLAQVFGLERVYACDQAPSQADMFAGEMSDELRLEVIPVQNLAAAVGESDICVTCTTSRRPLLRRADVRAGTFVAAVGADNPLKQELDSRLLSANKVVVDVLEQCAMIGDLHHALAQGAMTKADVYAELGEVVAGLKPGRTSAEETIIFDSTGTALQDVAAAVIVYEKAMETGIGFKMNFAE
jgi:alanine dehydrogenase